MNPAQVADGIHSYVCAAYQESIPTSRDELDEFLRTEISAVDVAKDVIVTKLADDVRANHDAFIQGMKQVQEVDLDLVRAQIHVKNGRRLLVSARNDLIIRFGCVFGSAGIPPCSQLTFSHLLWFSAPWRS